MSIPENWSGGSGHKNWLLPLVLMVGAGVYSWKVRREEAAARREKFERRLDESHRRESAVPPATDDSVVSHPSSTLTGRSVEETAVPPLAGFRVSAAAKPSSSGLMGSVSAGAYESVVLSPMEARDLSIRLFPDSLSTPQPTSVCASTDGRPLGSTARSVSRGDGRVQVAALTLQMRADFVEQPSSYSFPVQTCSFVHQDGSRLYVMAEEMTATREPVSTAQYVTQSVERLRTVTQGAKTYFKVKLNTAASMIVTTIMERYVSIHIGPSPSIAICFFLVRDGVAYTIQLQCQPEEYENRLADVLMAVQTARLDPDAPTACHGHNCYALRVPPRAPASVSASASSSAVLAAVAPPSSQRTYTVHLPTELIVHQNPSDATALLLTHAHSPTWSGEIRAMSADEVASFEYTCTPVVLPLSVSAGGGESTTAEAMASQVTVPEFVPLIDGELYAHLNPRSAAERQALLYIHALLTTPSKTWAEFVTTESTASSRPAALGDSSKVAPCFYISPQMRLPLPPVHQFTTHVCEHLGDRGVTLFIRDCSSDVFEMELRIIALREAQLPCFTAAIDKLFVAPVNPQPTTNAAGQRIISAEGLATAGGEVTLRLDCVQVKADNWLIIRWLFDDSNIFTRELEQYKERLYGTVFV